MIHIIPNDCPFCGSDRVSVRDKWLRADSYAQKRGAYAHCHTCGARGPLVSLEQTFDVRNEAVSAEGRRELQRRAILNWNKATAARDPGADGLPLFKGESK